MRHFVEGTAVPVEGGLPARQILPTLHDDVSVLRIEFHTAAHALGHFRRGERGATTEKRLVYKLTAPDVIQDRTPHQIHRLLSGMIILLDRKSTRLNSSHLGISYAVFCLKKKK